MLKFKYHIISILEEISKIWEVPLSEFSELKDLLISDFNDRAKYLVDKYVTLYKKLYNEVTLSLSTILTPKEDRVLDLNDQDDMYLNHLIIKREVLYSYIVGSEIESNPILLKLN
jgi:hypothetical protein